MTVPVMDQRDFTKARQSMISAIAADARETESWTGRRAFSPRVMAAITTVPRHAFVLEDDIASAYVNRPLGIGHGQTISQPYIVALMTDLLDLGETDRVLEIGTGSGYQAAILAELAGRVFTVEAIETLAETARRRLHGLGYDTVDVRTGDGYEGWPERYPFDGIIVTAAPKRIPEALIDQLRPGGRMVIPIGRPSETQNLRLGTKDDRGEFTTTSVLPVAFVPMVRGRPDK